MEQALLNVIVVLLGFFILMFCLSMYFILKDERMKINTLVNEEDLLIKYHKDIEEAKDWEEVVSINSQFISRHPENLTPSGAYLSIRKRTRPR